MEVVGEKGIVDLDLSLRAPAKQKTNLGLSFALGHVDSLSVTHFHLLPSLSGSLTAQVNPTLEGSVGLSPVGKLRRQYGCSRSPTLSTNLGWLKDLFSLGAADRTLNSQQWVPMVGGQTHTAQYVQQGALWGGWGYTHKC